MLKFLTFIQKDSFSLSDIDFGKVKVDLERWYYHMGGKGMYFEYREEYLITPKDASAILRVSNVTLNKYMKQGLEAVDTTSHNKIPKHAVELWKDPVYAIRMQMLMQERELRNQSQEEQLKEVRDEILVLQKQYKAKTVKEAINNRNIDKMDVMDDPSDFRHWKDLEIGEKNILEELTGGTEFI